MNEHTHVSKRSPDSPLICKICGDIARGLNFNIITCISCKAFFRRNAYRQQYIQQCLHEGHCSVTKMTRNLCSACRLEKCFQLGMDRLLIRRIQREPRKSTSNMIKNKSFELPKPQTLNLLQNDKSMLTNDQWTLISNIIHVYDDVHPIDQIRQSIRQIACLPPKLRLKSMSIADNVNKFYASIQLLVQRCPDFSGLPADIYHILFKNNISVVGGLNNLFVHRELNSSEFPFITSAALTFYGDEVISNSLQQTNRVDSNGNLVKILVLILCFSTNTSVTRFDPKEDYRSYSNSHYGINIQHFYVSVFWKYLLHLYGFDQAVLRFSSLIKLSVDLMYTAALLSEHKIHNQMLQSVVSSINQSLSLSD